MYNFRSFKRIGVDQYIAQIIFEEAKRITTEIKAPPVLDDSTFTPAVAIKKEDYHSDLYKFAQLGLIP